MAGLAWGIHQHRIYLAFRSWIKTQRILEHGTKSELHLAGTRDRRVFHRGMGACLEMALSAWPHKKNSHKDDVPNHNNWIYGK